MSLSEAAGQLLRLKHLPATGEVEDDVFAPGGRVRLRRCLSLFSVTSIGLGVMLCSGIYTVTGVVIENVVGPAAVISYILAAICALMSALCYAELASRVPKAGSAYIYSYVTVGELVAFVVGWSLLIEYCVATASISKAWSAYLDAMLNHTIQHHIVQVIGQLPAAEDSAFNDTLDVVAVLLITFVAALAAIGVRTSTGLLKVLFVANVCAIGIIVCYGATFADLDNWLPLRRDGQGFTPYGLPAIMTASSLCFFAFTGFEAICTVAEETNSSAFAFIWSFQWKNPRKTIPRALLLSIGLAALAMIAMSSSLSLMVPFDQVRGESAFADAFNQHDVHWARVLVSLGAMSGLSSGVIVNVMASSRLLYAMAGDGILYEPLAYVHPNTQTPVLAVLCVWLMAVVLATVFTVHTLVEFVAIDTMMAYTIVVVCVLVLRYRPHHVQQASSRTDGATNERSALLGSQNVVKTSIVPSISDVSLSSGIDHKPGPKSRAAAVMMAPLRSMSADRLIGLILAIVVVACLVVRFAVYFGWYWPGVVITVTLLLAILRLTACLAEREQYRDEQWFQVPCLPWLPVCSVFLNLLLILFLPLITWGRFVIWSAVGLVIYAVYGFKHSHENGNRLADYD